MLCFSILYFFIFFEALFTSCIYILSFPNYFQYFLFFFKFLFFLILHFVMFFQALVHYKYSYDNIDKTILKNVAKFFRFFFKVKKVAYFLEIKNFGCLPNGTNFNTFCIFPKFYPSKKRLFSPHQYL